MVDIQAHVRKELVYPSFLGGNSPYDPTQSPTPFAVTSMWLSRLWVGVVSGWWYWGRDHGGGIGAFVRAKRVLVPGMIFKYLRSPLFDRTCP